jgi:ribonuclease VapC
MALKSRAYALDTWAVIAYLGDGPSASQIADLSASAHEESIPILMTVVNVGEVWYIIAREVSEEEANNSIKELHDLRIQFVDVDWELTREAARFRSHHKMSYADCCAAALAKNRNAELVTGDKEFKTLQDEIKISWT